MRGSPRERSAGSGLARGQRPEAAQRRDGALRVNTPQRAAAFLAQVAHESGEFQRLVENLSYTAARLCNDDNDDEDFIAITKAINGGTAGLTSRRQYWVRAQTALGLAPRGAGV